MMSFVSAVINFVYEIFTPSPNEDKSAKAITEEQPKEIAAEDTPDN